LQIINITPQIRILENFIKTEKLAAIGTLTVAIAHEINNPINFIASSIQPLKQDIEDLILIYKKYAALQADEEFSKNLQGIKELESEMELDFSISEIEKLIESISDGSNRTLEIIKDLRSFTYAEEKGKKKYNLHDKIETTLALLKSKHKNRITIEKEYGDLPALDGYPSKINQVLMNLLANAMDAIPNEGTIKIKTYQIDEKSIGISILDSGSGMSQEVLSRLFQPFFTTKGEGVGSGLGLLITKGIIEEHHGKISVKSEPGKGSEFIIELPI
jgi:signal transduction histidine kinase